MGRVAVLSSAVFLSAIILFQGVSGSFAAEKVRIAGVTYPAFGFWAIAQEKGLAPDLDIEYQKIEDLYESMSLATAGHLDVVAGTVEFAPIAASRNLPISLVAYANLSYGVDKIILAPGFKTAADLVGQKVGVLEGGLAQLYVAIWLEQNGIAFDKVSYVNLIMDEAASAMLGGDIAAAEFWEPFGNQVMSSGLDVTVAAQSKEPYWLESGLLADSIYMTNDFINKRRDVAVKTMKALYDGIDWWAANPTEGNQIIAKAMGLSVADVELVLGKDGSRVDGGVYPYSLIEAAQFCGSAAGDPPFGQKNGQIVQLWKVINEWWIKFNQMTETVDPSKGIDCSLLGDLAAKN
jgi:NitT/TauT family transport system substrate-binding protein